MGGGAAGQSGRGPSPRGPQIYSHLILKIIKSKQEARIPFNWIVDLLFLAFHRHCFDRKSYFLKYLLIIFIWLSEWDGGLTFVTGQGYISPHPGPEYIYVTYIPSKLTKAVKFSTCILEVTGSYLGRDTDYPYSDSSWFFSPLQENAQIILQVCYHRFSPHPFQFIIHCHTLDAIQSRLVTA
jgi:hypothetical protein